MSTRQGNQVSVLVSKKIGKNFCSWSLSYGATPKVEDEEHFTEVISQLDSQLRKWSQNPCQPPTETATDIQIIINSRSNGVH